eukprot:4350717-Ditylum_brightwellii.AAC.1
MVESWAVMVVLRWACLMAESWAVMMAWRWAWHMVESCVVLGCDDAMNVCMADGRGLGCDGGIDL